MTEPAITPRRWRQMVRKGMAALLPRRMFLINGPPDSNSVCLTFDDGPHPENTPRLLDVLKDRGVITTFFVIGQNVERYPEIVRRMAVEGHLVGQHSFYHTKPELTSARQLIDEIRSTQRLLKDLIGPVPALIRPPSGKLSIGKMLRLWGEGQTIVLWNVDPKEFTHKSADEVGNWFHECPLRGGDLVLMHDNLPFAAEVLPEVIAATQERGLSFKTIDQWVRWWPHPAAGIRP